MSYNDGYNDEQAFRWSLSVLFLVVQRGNGRFCMKWAGFGEKIPF